MNRLIAPFVFLMFCAAACNHDHPNFFFKEEGFPVDTIYVKAPDEHLTAEDIFAQIEFIPLETNRTSLFANIDNIIVLSDRYIILDRESNVVLIFEKSGKFIGKFDHQYNEKDIKFSKIILDTNTEEIWVKDINSFYIIVFGKDGALRRVMTEKSDYYTFTIRDGDIVFFNHYLPNGKNVDSRSSTFLLHVKDTATLSTKHRLLEYNTKSIRKGELVNNLKNFYWLNDTLHLTLSGELKFYTLDEDNRISMGHFLKLDSINFFQTPADFLSNIKYLGKRRDYLKKNPELYDNIRSIYKNKSGTIYTIENKKGYENIIHTNKNSPLFAEDLSYNMDFFGLPPIPIFVIGNDEEWFYSFYTSKAFLSIINKTSNRSSLLENDSTIWQIYKHQTLFSNPILVRFKLKV